MPSAPRTALRLLPALAAGLLLTACGGGGGEMQMPPPDVNVATVQPRKIQTWDEFNGRIEAVDTVELRPRVSGHLAAVHFQEGGVVGRGDLLFSIDDREFRAAVDSARANLARAESRVTLAQTEFARSQRLIEARAVSQGELEQRRGELQQAQADRAAAQAALAQAELNLGFTRITAPISGRVGAALVRPGNLVNPGTTLLSTVVSLDPVHVVFEGDERLYLRYQQMARDGERPSSRDVANPVRVGLADEEGFPHEGRMDFVDNRLDPSTGTIRGRALLPNPDGVFTPGLFARIRLLGSGERQALLVHPNAVLTDQDRKYVYVLGPREALGEMAAALPPGVLPAIRKDVVLGAEVDGLRIVESGLAAGDRVVVNGVRKIFFPGMPVNPIEVPMERPDQAPPAPAAAEAPAAAH
jgi:multidrug efflux system membrane fusion protein